MPKRWMQKLKIKKGALTNWMKRNRKKLKRILGFDPITKKGDINNRAVYKLLSLHKKGRIRLSRKTIRRLNLAKVFYKVRRR